MDEAAVPDGPSGGTEAGNAVDVVLRLGSIMLSAGSPTDDVERAMRTAAASVGLERATAARLVRHDLALLLPGPGPGSRSPPCSSSPSG